MKVSSKYKNITEFLILLADSSISNLELIPCEFKSSLLKEGYLSLISRSLY